MRNLIVSRSPRLPRVPLAAAVAVLLAGALTGCGMSSGLRSGTSGSSGSGGGGSNGGGGRTAALVKFFTPPRGGETSWFAHSALPGLDLKIRSGSSTGVTILYVRNRYKDRISFSYDAGLVPPSDTRFRNTKSAGSENRINSWDFGGAPVVYVLIDKVRFGKDDPTTPYF